MIRKISGLLLGATIAVAASMMPAMQAAAQSDPGIAVGEPNPSGASSYRVRQGDTVESIARSTGVPPAQIIALNPGLGARSLLPPGIIIYLPIYGGGPVQATPSLTIEPRSGPLSTPVRIRATGLRPGERVRLLAGPSPYDLRPLEQLRANRNGRVNVTTELPRERGARFIHFAVRSLDRRLQIGPERFRVESRGPDSSLVRVTGRIADRDLACPLLRGDDGRTYSLLGRLGGFRAGDRVFVEGRRVEVSICTRGTAIEVRRIEFAR